MDSVALLAGLALPWLLGIGIVLLLRPVATAPGAPGEIAWTAGAGYLAGAFLLTAWMRVLSIQMILNKAAPASTSTASADTVSPPSSRSFFSSGLYAMPRRW